jgi:low temperature requirement protein LtrA
VSGGGAEDLLRKPDQPPRATFLELFFDLVFVFALSRVSGRLVADLTSHHRSLVVEDGETLLLLLALLMVWFVTAWVTDLYDQGAPAGAAAVLVAAPGYRPVGVRQPEERA